MLIAVAHIVLCLQVRSKVSADRTRFKDEHTNLDLSYITDNLIGNIFLKNRNDKISHVYIFFASAMGFPASGIESTWRNHIDEVAAIFHWLLFL